MMTSRLEFIAESNRIEGILRDPSPAETEAHEVFWALPKITVADLEEFVMAVAHRPLRRYPGMNVRVGRHTPAPGGPAIEQALKETLVWIEEGLLTPFQAHQRYELIHPFMDGNGRSGRALWAWHMDRVGEDPFALPFLHRWYYQSLDAARPAPPPAEAP